MDKIKTNHRRCFSGFDGDKIMSENNLAVIAESLTRKFGKFVAVDEVSIEVKKGTFE